MNTENITTMASQLQAEMPFMEGINTPEEYEQAIALVDQLVEDYDGNLLLLNLLWPKIEEYEESDPEMIEFNKQVNEMDAGASMLRLIMEHHNLKTSDFQNEIGVKSVVSMITNEQRKLTADHIRKLSARFNISPALFF